MALKLLRGRLEQVIENRLSTENVAVFLIDMQNDSLIVQRSRMDAHYVPAIRRQKEILKFAIARRLPILIFEISVEEEGHTISPLLNEVSNYDRLQIIQKPNASAFMGTNIAKLLEGKNIRTVLVMGETAGICIFHTLLDAEDEGLSTITSFSVLVEFGDHTKEMYADLFDRSTLRLCEIYDDK
ncbi:hypothetical protein COV18_04810 [Candidatus Woesearchaeota archaeon CG10_big_fil_rev_8_21_14_0_10_37_12]|nr:MAG: hypothetical protein COV18_04810 [Candidatus Woesearchaeota archaeon CG10_big_fil_rev_8_21_14_0_10_37_12]